VTAVSIEEGGSKVAIFGRCQSMRRSQEGAVPKPAKASTKPINNTIARHALLTPPWPVFNSNAPHMRCDHGAKRPKIDLQMT
jgi:hypothetical protein